MFQQRQYPQLIPHQMKQDPELVNKIIHLAITRAGKDSSQIEKLQEFSNILASTTTTTTTTEKPTTTSSTTTVRAVNRDEFAKAQMDIESYNNDLKLLSTLLGRPIGPNEIPKLARQVTSTTTTTTTVSPALKDIQLKPNFNLPEDIFLDDSNSNIYGKSNEAILAAVLKEKGIGPANNNIPVHFEYPTTQRTVYRTTRQPRPIIDGLSWLWKTWQETAPATRPGSVRVPAPAALTNVRLPGTYRTRQVVDDGTDPEITVI